MNEIKRSDDETYNVFMGIGGKKLIHWEHWSNPDAETYLTGIDYYEHPRLCRLKLRELYPMLGLPVPETDAPIPKPKFGGTLSSNSEQHTVRWGDSETGTFLHGAFFKTPEDVFNFSPLEHADFSKWNGSVVENHDFTSEEKIYQRLRPQYPKEWEDKAPEGSSAGTGFYNTMFMWPLLTFGWELFLECCLDDRFERIMDEFAEINRRVFRAFAKLPINFVTCHDDIVMTRGPVCSPEWMNKYIFPRYEEFWAILKSAGKEVIFMADGCMDAYADNVFACGARGIVSEPYTDYKAIARKHKDCFISGEGDNRILNRNDPDEIRAMVESMVETGKMSRGYMMGIGNHIPWNVNPEGIKCYLDLSDEIGYR